MSDCRGRLTEGFFLWGGFLTEEVPAAPLPGSVSSQSTDMEPDNIPTVLGTLKGAEAGEHVLPSKQHEGIISASHL